MDGMTLELTLFLLATFAGALVAGLTGFAFGLVVSATILGMAFGGYVSGVIFDWTHSYAMAFLNGVAWNGVNLAVVGWLFWRRRWLAPAGRLAAAA